MARREERGTADPHRGRRCDRRQRDADRLRTLRRPAFTASPTSSGSCSAGSAWLSPCLRSCGAPRSSIRGAWGALKTRTLHMDLPIAIGILAGFIQGAVNTVRGTGEIYFDSVTALIFFLLVGRFLQRRQQRRAASSTELLFSLAPSTARLVDAEGVREVPLEALSPGAPSRSGPATRSRPTARLSTALRPSIARCSPASRCRSRSRSATRSTPAPSTSVAGCWWRCGSPARTPASGA